MKFNLLFVFLAVILLMPFTLAFAWDPPSESHNANAMWIEPSTIDLNTGNPEHTIGYKFNVTLYLNISESYDVFQYQIALKYNRTQLRATRAAFTQPPTSEFMQGHASTALIQIDISFLGNGSVLATEALSGTDFINCTLPTWGSLLWIEFEVMAEPPPGETMTSSINLSEQTPADNWVWTIEAEDLLTTEGAHDATYIIPEFPGIPLVVVFMGVAMVAILIATKLQSLSTKHV